MVGKYGPTSKQIEDYALRVKASADGLHPGMIKGIFFAKGGDYNQDLNSHSLLLEVGVHTNDWKEAERGIALFSDVVPSVIGGTAANNSVAGHWFLPGNYPGKRDNRGNRCCKSIAWFFDLTAFGVIAFLFLSTGRFKELKAKLKQFTITEFANFFAPKDKNDKDKK